MLSTAIIVVAGLAVAAAQQPDDVASKPAETGKPTDVGKPTDLPTKPTNTGKPSDAPTGSGVSKVADRDARDMVNAAVAAVAECLKAATDAVAKQACADTAQKSIDSLRDKAAAEAKADNDARDKARADDKKTVDDLSTSFKDATTPEKFAAVCTHIISRQGAPIDACTEPCKRVVVTADDIKKARAAAIDCAQAATKKALDDDTAAFKGKADANKDKLDKDRADLKAALNARLADLPDQAKAAAQKALDAKNDADKSETDRQAHLAEIKLKIDAAKAKRDDAKASKADKAAAQKELASAAADAVRQNVQAKLKGNRDKIVQAKLDAVKAKLAELHGSTKPADFTNDAKVVVAGVDVDSDKAQELAVKIKAVHPDADTDKSGSPELEVDSKAEDDDDDAAAATATKTKKRGTTVHYEVYVPTSNANSDITGLTLTTTIVANGGTVTSMDTFGQSDVQAAQPVVTKATADTKAGANALALALGVTLVSMIVLMI